jgi:hypothetical protein
MSSFRAILQMGESLAALAEAERQDQISKAVRAHGARQEAKRAARIAEGWDLALAPIAHGAPHLDPDKKDGVDGEEEPKGIPRRKYIPPPPRRRRRGPPSSASPMAAPTSAQQSWDQAMQEAASTEGAAQSAAPAGGSPLSRLWRSMFPVG